MKRLLIPLCILISSLALSSCGVYTASCGSTCPTRTTYVTTTSTCCATCNPCYGYGYSWY
ncbi:hypothetical protein [Legionella nagasakiensis]|uniref:hypothetical protein n=1 Tax=Legionella nagasakiensis TaxID=535290 RepID=UPI0010568104|nr:hypothetical protein [Legionella nagasakiensis]